MSELKPGPELDRLVAERVMGWCEIPRCQGAWKGWDGTDTIVGKGSRDKALGWHPSWDIRAAWEVVERFRDIWFVLNSRQHDGDWYCQAGDYRNDVIGQTAPHAICLAALKAMEDDDAGEGPSEAQR